MLPEGGNMAKRNLTDRTLKALKPAAAGKLYDVMDTVVPGFGVRVSDSGRRTFMLVARYPGSSNPARRSIGAYGAITLADARQTAQDWLKLIKVPGARNTAPARKFLRLCGREIHSVHSSAEAPHGSNDGAEPSSDLC